MMTQPSEESTTIALDRSAPARRPAGHPAGFQRWTNLLFVHWPVPAAAVRPFVPPELTLDTWDGDAWIGLVLFYMSGVRARFVPPLPGLSCFCETNVRTYVHLRGRDPGVWFFSLDASNSPAVWFARRYWHLPYYRSRMTLARRDDTLEYSSRRAAEPNPCGYHVQAEIGPLLGTGIADSPLPAGRALPGTLEHFLIERYILYVTDPAGKLLAGRVHHAPYPIRDVRSLSLDESMLSAAGLARPEAPAHVAFSDGVQVEIFPLRDASSK
jgi:uncharacterized protein YqjF (DUF2071 family)